jgi:hypothetical protein
LVIAGVTTVPEMLVVAPAEHVTRRRQRLVHMPVVPPGVPHTLGVPPPPHVCGAVQLPH